MLDYLACIQIISIHALREEGDALSSQSYRSATKFLSTPSARRATMQKAEKKGLLPDFYPRPPRGGRLICRCAPSPRWTISIHALREEGDQMSHVLAALMPISIHALREEGDARRARRGPLHRGFLSTPSARRATTARWALAVRSRFLSTPSARRAT